MLRQKIDEYLDGALNSAERSEFEATLTRDPQAAKLLTGARAQRALRTAAYQSYLPTEHEARSLAAQVMAEARHAPVGRIGMWVRRGAAVAAGLVIVAGAFYAGQGSAPTKYVNVAQTKMVYSVVYTDTTGSTMVSEFDSLKDRNDFVSDLEQRGSKDFVVSDLALLPPHI